MAIRNKLNQMPGLVTGVALLLVVIAGYMLYRMGRANPEHGLPTDAYFSDDDGQTYFRDDIRKMPPFDRSGKEAVRAYVFQCADGKPFVGLLSKLEPSAKTVIEQEIADLKANPSQPSKHQMESMAAQQNGWLYKKPGEKDWVKRGMGYATAATPACPDRSSASTVK